MDGMGFDEILWDLMEFDGTWWNLMGFDGIWWNVMGFDEIWWNSGVLKVIFFVGFQLKSLGFPEQMVVEAYMVCDKNEQQAANFLFSQLDEFEQAGGSRGGAAQ